VPPFNLIFTDAAFGNAACFAQAAISGLPLPVYGLQVIALGQQDGPQNIEDALAFPAGKGAVDTAVVAELFGQMVPLAARPHPKDDAVEGLARVTALAASFGRRVVDSKDFVDEFPERIGNVPDRGQGFFLAFRGAFRGSVFRYSGFILWHHATIIGARSDVS